jgi:hypothetical protein
MKKLLAILEHGEERRSGEYWRHRAKITEGLFAMAIAAFLFFVAVNHTDGGLQEIGLQLSASAMLVIGIGNFAIVLLRLILRRQVPGRTL